MIEITMTSRGIAISALSIPRIGPFFIMEVIGEGYRLLRSEAPVKTEKLRQSIRQQSRGLKGEVTIGAPYAVFVATGTQPHIIRPARAQALRFEVAGDIIFSTLVRHPGTKPNPFIRRAAERLARRIPEIFQRIWKKNVR
jgi:HK97 gp10 family phage protein